MKLKQRMSISIMSAALGLFLIAGGTYAYFSDSVEVKAESVTGTLEMNINESSSFNFDNMKPGDVQDIKFTLTNDGSLDIQRIFLDVTNSNPELAKYLKVTKFTVGSDDQFRIARIGDRNGNGYVDLDDLATISNGDPINLRGSFNLNTGVRNIHIQVEFHDTGEPQNDLQGVVNNMTLDLMGVQNY